MVETALYAPPMRLRPWIKRLAEHPDRWELLRDVKGSADLAAAMAEPKSLHRNTLFVMLERETRLGDNHETRLRKVGVATVLTLVSYRDRRGEDGILSDLEAAREAVSHALLGWEPPGAAGHIEFEAGNMVDFDKRTLWWRDTWSVPAFAPAPVPDTDCDAPTELRVSGCPVPLAGLGPPTEGPRVYDILEIP